MMGQYISLRLAVISTGMSEDALLDAAIEGLIHAYPVQDGIPHDKDALMSIKRGGGHDVVPGGFFDTNPYLDAEEVKVFAQTYGAQKRENNIPKPKKQKVGITQVDAAKLVGKSVSTIANWDRGKGSPEGYPGRQDLFAFRQWVNMWETSKKQREAAINMNRAVPASSVSTGDEYLVDNLEEDPLKDM